MATDSDPLDLVTLRSGAVLPVAVIIRAIDLNARGVELWRDDENYLRATPKELLTPEDRVFLKANRDALLLVVDESNRAQPC